MRKRLLTTLLACLPAAALADSVTLGQLGLLDVEFATVGALDRYEGQPLAARVSFRPGEAIHLVTPYRVQQISYLVEPGDTVSTGQPIAVLAGPEIHHFLTEFAVTEQRLALTEQRYERNRKLYQQQAIDEARWIEISDAYMALKLEYEHLRHFRELLSEDAEGDDRVVLNSPAAGLIRYDRESPGLDSGEELALLVPAGALRLQVSVPLRHRDGLTALATRDCELAVARVSGIARDFFVEAWSEPVQEQCGLLPGQRLMVQAVYSNRAYRLPREAVFQWQGEPSVLLRQEDRLVTVSVELLSADSLGYTVRCPTDIAGGEVLTTSVSAVQGILLGLGGE